MIGTIIRIAAEIVAAVAIALLLRTFVAALVIVKGNSMNPTLKNGEVMLALMGRWRRVRRGDVVICRYPGRGRKFFVKRAVGLPGDEVCRTGGVTLLNGESLDARAYVYRSEYEYTLADDEYFCVGDNRGNSHDSRDWQRVGNNQVGPLPRRMICGTAKWVIWPPKARRKIGREFAFSGADPVIKAEEEIQTNTEMTTEGGDTDGNERAE